VHVDGRGMRRPQPRARELLLWEVSRFFWVFELACEREIQWLEGGVGRVESMFARRLDARPDLDSGLTQRAWWRAMTVRAPFYHSIWRGIRDGSGIWYDAETDQRG
jgi:hypothetical protein